MQAFLMQNRFCGSYSPFNSRRSKTHFAKSLESSAVGELRIFAYDSYPHTRMHAERRLRCRPRYRPDRKSRHFPLASCSRRTGLHVLPSSLAVSCSFRYLADADTENSLPKHSKRKTFLIPCKAMESIYILHLALEIAYLSVDLEGSGNSNDNGLDWR